MKNRVFLTPFNDITMKLSKEIDFLEKNEFLGFIDNNKGNAFSIDKIKNTNF